MGGEELAPKLDFLRGNASERKLRLLLAACCRAGWSFLTDIRSREAVEAAEKYADGLIGKKDLQRAHGRATSVTQSKTSQLALLTATPTIKLWKLGWLSGNRIGVGMVLDIFGNPFHPSTPLPSSVTAWNDGTVRRIAAAIYEERQLRRKGRSTPPASRFSPTPSSTRAAAMKPCFSTAAVPDHT